jgi:hypothetical protein
LAFDGPLGVGSVSYLEAAAGSGHKLNDDYNGERQDGFARMQSYSRVLQIICETRVVWREANAEGVERGHQQLVADTAGPCGQWLAGRPTALAVRKSA